MFSTWSLRAKVLQGLCDEGLVMRVAGVQNLSPELGVGIGMLCCAV